MKTTLITTYYNEKVKERNNELLTCIRANIAIDSIDRVVIIIEPGTIIPFRHTKVVWKEIPQRPTFKDFVDTANNYDSPIKIIANTDIYFDDYHLNIVKVAIKENECYALSRWDVQSSGDISHHSHQDSQDVWIFKGKIRKFESSFLLGKCGIDNRIAFEIDKAGYDIVNPSKTIKSYHLHITGIRNYRRVESEVIPKPYKLVPPVYLGEKARTEVTINVGGEMVRRPIHQPEPTLTEFDYAKQKKQMEDMLLSGSIPKKFLLTICVPTMHSRKEQWKLLRKELMRQIVENRLTTKVEIKELLDDGYAPIGWKRNKLNIEARGRYVAHFDDDDWPAPDYVISLVNGIEGNYGVDVITFNGKVTFDGVNEEKMYFHHKYVTQQYFQLEGKPNYREIMPTHLCAIRRECALENAFQVFMKNGARNRSQRQDSGSDVHYAMDMVNNKTLKTNIHIDKELYHYKYKHKN